MKSRIVIFALIIALVGLTPLAPGSVAGADTQSGQQFSGQTSDGLVWGYDETEPAYDWTKPDLHQKYRDPAYNTVLRRRTDATGTRFDRNTYSRRQAESARGRYFLSYHGTAKYHVQRPKGTFLAILDIHPDGNPQWHPTKPNILLHTSGSDARDGSLKLYQTNVKRGKLKVVADLSDDLTAIWPDAVYISDGAEGSPSADGSRNAWVVYDSYDEPIGIVNYDINTKEVLGVRVPHTDKGKLGWVSASPTGDYVIAGYRHATYVYDADLSNERLLNNNAEHSDIALNKDGRDAYVYIDFSDNNAGWLVSTDLDDLSETLVFNIYRGGNTSIHISGKGYDKPGWVIASTYNCKAETNWTCDKIFAVELEPNGRILNLAHAYNCGEDYWTETHAVVNRKFTKVYFNSDGGSCGIDAEVYQLRVPEFD